MQNLKNIYTFHCYVGTDMFLQKSKDSKKVYIILSERILHLENIYTYSVVAEKISVCFEPEWNMHMQDIV